MKKCPYCGLENPDASAQCGICHAYLDASFQPSQSVPMVRQEMSPEGRRFWQQMTFREFAIFFVRLQAIWFLFYTVDSATYLPSYFGRFHESIPSSPGYSQASHTLFWALIRVIWHLAAAVACVQYAESIVDWIVKDSISKLPPDTSPTTGKATDTPASE